MILDRRQSRWVLGTGAAAAFALGAYFVYASLVSNGPRGGSKLGLFFVPLFYTVAAPRPCASTPMALTPLIPAPLARISLAMARARATSDESK